MFAHHYIAVAIAALSGLIFLHLVADKTKYDRSDLQESCFECIQAMVGIEVFIILALFVSFIVGSDGFFLHIKDTYGPRTGTDSDIPISIMVFCGVVTGTAIHIKTKHLNENGKFYDLLIGMCIFLHLNLVLTHLLYFTITIERFIWHLAFGFALFLVFSAFAIFRCCSAMKSSPAKSM